MQYIFHHTGDGCVHAGCGQSHWRALCGYPYSPLALRKKEKRIKDPVARIANQKEGWDHATHQIIGRKGHSNKDRCQARVAV